MVIGPNDFSAVHCEFESCRLEIFLLVPIQLVTGKICFGCKFNNCVSINETPE